MQRKLALRDRANEEALTHLTHSQLAHSHTQTQILIHIGSHLLILIAVVKQ